MINTETIDDLRTQCDQAWRELESARLDLLSVADVIAEGAVVDGRLPHPETAAWWSERRAVREAASARHRELCDRLSEAYAAQRAAKTSGVGATVPAPAPA